MSVDRLFVMHFVWGFYITFSLLVSGPAIPVEYSATWGPHECLRQLVSHFVQHFSKDHECDRRTHSETDRHASLTSVAIGAIAFSDAA